MSYRLLSTRRLRPAAAILALLALATPPARAQTNYYWNPPVGGGGVWDISTRNWSTVATGPDDYVWTNSGNEVANFGNQPGGVFLNAPITAGGINFTTNYVLFNNVAANSLTLAGGGVIDTGSNTDTVNVVIAGAAGLTKNGTGTLVLSGTSTYTGAVAVNVGVLSITNASGLGAAANTVTVANGAALQVNGGVTVAQPITLTGNGVANGGALRNIFDGNTLSGAITIAAGGARINSDVLGTQGAPTLTVSTGGINGAAANTPLTFGGAGNVTVSGAIGGNIGTITKDGAGTLTLSGTNAYTGATTISGGALAVNSSGALGATTGVTVAAGAAVQLGGTTTTAAAPLTLNGFGSTTSAGGVSTGGALRGTATGIWSGAITLASAARINSDSGTLSLTGGIDAAAAGTPLTIGGGGGTAIGGPGISSNVGPLIKDGPGLLTLSVANAYTGGTTVSGSGVVGNAQPSGSPFGSATGAITLNEASLGLFGIATTTTTTVGDLIIGAPSGTSSGGAGLVINNTAGQPSAATTTLAAGNLVRGGPGSVLIIAPTTGSLGTGEVLTFTGGTTLTNGILPPWVTAQVSATNPALDFVTYGASGVATATYTSTDVTTSTSASIVNQSTPVTLAGPAAAYALKTNAAITLGGNTLTLGSGTGPAGLILNTGASITGGTVTFGSREGVVYFQGTATLGAAGDTITSNGLAVTAVAASTLTLGGNITGSGPLLLTGTTSGTGVTISGNNTYTGGTVLSVNTGTAANIVLGSDTAFGTGKVTNILAPGSASPQIQATAPRTLANAFDLNGGLTFTGSNNITFTGPVTIIQPQAGGTRTLNDGTGTTATVTFGATPNSSTITLGNPVANGGDGVGKTLVFAPAATSTFVINDVMQDPAAGGGAAGGSVSYAGAAGGITVINSKSTYTGPTNLNGSSIIRFSTDYNPAAGDTSGPFGVGTLNPNQATNNRLQPIGGGTRIIGNPMQLSTGFIVENSGTDTTSVTFSGPISMTNGRTI
ncbi:MAG TPA: autotransporter-associated beta strand repeat-containing protein, partial [Gemmataceae bacterium]